MKEAPNLERFGEVPLPAAGDGPGWWVSAGGRDVPVCGGRVWWRGRGSLAPGCRTETAGKRGRRTGRATSCVTAAQRALPSEIRPSVPIPSLLTFVSAVTHSTSLGTLKTQVDRLCLLTVRCL